MDTIKYISVPNSTKREIRKVFNCSRIMVWYALNYQKDSPLAKRIRKFALDKGGGVYDESRQNFTNLSK
jgi:hypothetical protein